MNRPAAALSGMAALLCMGPDRLAAQSLPQDFELEQVAGDLDQPVAIAFAGDGRMFIAEKRGVVRILIDGAPLPSPFIDLSDEVDSTILRGMLGFALDPDFLDNGHVYMAYPVVPEGGTRPKMLKPTFSRVVRYTGTPASGGNVADPASRLVLIGEQPHEGIPACYAHLFGALRFGEDGSLLVSTGDAAHYEFPDGGGNDPDCFLPPLFDPGQDIGAFRAQHLDSLAGKILRIDPATGLGLPDNPYWSGDPAAARSRVWAYGLRMPYRFIARPGTGSPSFPGVLYIGEVGWNRYEELSIGAAGGENFGWPCFEGLAHATEYRALDPPHAGCDTLESPENPGPLIEPIMWWHYTNPGLSFPDNVTGRTIIGGAFYTGAAYPAAYHDAYFYADYSEGWIRVLRVNEFDEHVESFGFATDVPQPVEVAADPVSGDIHIVQFAPGAVYRLRYTGDRPADLNRDGAVNVQDLLTLLAAWGDCRGGPRKCPADLNGDGAVDVDDLLLMLANWG